MHLRFRKDEESQILVYNVIDGEAKEFSYVEMVKTLLESRHMDEPDIGDEFSEAEITSIHAMVRYINEELSGAVSADDEPEEEPEGDQ